MKILKTFAICFLTLSIITFASLAAPQAIDSVEHTAELENHVQKLLQSLIAPPLYSENASQQEVGKYLETLRRKDADCGSIIRRGVYVRFESWSTSQKQLLNDTCKDTNLKFVNESQKIINQEITTVFDNLQPPAALKDTATSSEVKRQMVVLSEKQRDCWFTVLGGKTRAGVQLNIGEWPTQRREDLKTLCKELEISNKQLTEWARQELKGLELKEAKIASEIEEAKRKQFIEEIPDFLIVINKNSQNLSVAKKLDGTISIENKSKDVIKIQYYDLSETDQMHANRYKALIWPFRYEVGSRATGLANKSGLIVEFNHSNIISRKGQRTDLKNGPIDTIAVIDKGQVNVIKSYLDNGTYVIVGEIEGANVEKIAQKMQERVEAKASADYQKQLDISNRIKNTPDDVSAIILSDVKNQRICTVEKSNINDWGVIAAGYRSQKDFSELLQVKQLVTFEIVEKSVEALYKIIQKQQCAGIVLSNKDMSLLAEALQRDSIKFKFVTSKSQKELLLIYAQFNGFKDLEQYQFAEKIDATSTGIDNLASYKILNYESFNAAVRRMNSSGYSNSSDISELLRYLDDEVEGKKSNKTANQIRDIKLNKTAQALKDREAQMVKDLPKYKIIAGCMEPAAPYVETLMNILSTSPAQFVNAVSAQSKFCQVLSESVSDVSMVKNARLVARGSNGAEYSIVKNANGQAMLGIVKSP